MYRRPDGLYERILVIDGKRIAFRAKTEREVERKIIAFQGVQERGPLFSEVAEEWEEKHFPGLAYNTLRVYKPATRRAVAYFQEKQIREITPMDIKSYLAQLPKTWAQKTFQNHLLVLSMILDYAASEGHILQNPAEYVKIPKGKKRTYRRAPTQEEIDLIKKSIDKPFGLFAFFLLYTGCRRGEALALQFKDIDLEKTLYISLKVFIMRGIPQK